MITNPDDESNKMLRIDEIKITAMCWSYSDPAIEASTDSGNTDDPGNGNSGGNEPGGDGNGTQDADSECTGETACVERSPCDEDQTCCDLACIDLT